MLRCLWSEAVDRDTFFRILHFELAHWLVSSRVQPFLLTWIACLLSITSWAQVACLSGYSHPTVLRVLHSTVPHIISATN